MTPFRLRFHSALLTLALIGVSAATTAGYAQGGTDSLPADSAARDTLPPGLYGAVYTPKGTILIRLALEKTPMTVANFVGLAEGTLANDAFPPGRPFFDGSTFHRVVPGHVIQGGIPASDSAEGSGTPLPNEIDTTLSHGRAGMVGMANAGPHTATNQFYITLGDRSYLDGDYTVFGEVVSGMDVVMRIVQDDPIDSVRIIRVGDRAEAFYPTTDTFMELRRAVAERVGRHDAARRDSALAYIHQNWPTAIRTDSGWSYVILNEGAGDSIRPGDTVTVRYTGHTAPPHMVRFASTAEGTPYWPQPDAQFGRTFTYLVGETAVTPAFDDAVRHMRRGERRLVIVPPELGYASRGYYAPSVAGEKRFVIRPGSFLIYVIEIP